MTESTNTDVDSERLRSGTGRCRIWRWLAFVFAGLVLAYLVLLIPEHRFAAPEGAGKCPFVWNQNRFWSELEQEFVTARRGDPLTVSNQCNSLFVQTAKTLDELSSRAAAPGDPAQAALEDGIFRLAPLVAANPASVPRFAELVERARATTKKLSEAWDLGDAEVRAQLYRLLFGGRMALEMVLVQAPGCALPAACAQEPSATPSVMAQGVTFHSGDIFVSRGTKPTSSLISRGNDFPGNFSHVALLWVNEHTGEATVIESLIERGVVTLPFADFMRENRLRLMVLRLRSDLPAMRANPRLPHEAASSALKAATARHTAYDFAMEFRDPAKKFCSEVVSSAYSDAGIRLWMGMSYISSPVVTAWLASTGVRHFETQEPSDLEYDPQLRVVAEWRNPTTLFQAHLDDAVTDAMFATAKPGAPLDYSLPKLPLARVAKAYSVLLNAFGKVGPVPEGMSATSALRARQFAAEHQARKQHLASLAAEFRNQKGYAAPYWELLRMSREGQGP